jgi:hypothetical protein
MMEYIVAANDDNSPFSKLTEFSLTTNYDDNSSFFSNDGI